MKEVSIEVVEVSDIAIEIFSLFHFKWHGYYFTVTA